MNQFTCLNGKKRERGMPVHAASIWKSVRSTVSRRRDYYIAVRPCTMRLLMSFFLQMSVFLCSMTPLL